MFFGETPEWNVSPNKKPPEALRVLVLYVKTEVLSEQRP